MSRKDEVFLTTPPKKLRFRGDLGLQHIDGRVEDIFEEPLDRRRTKNGDVLNEDIESRRKGKRTSHL